MVVRLCARIRGSIARSACPPGIKRPVNIARPKDAEMPQKNVALAM